MTKKYKVVILALEGWYEDTKVEEEIFKGVDADVVVTDEDVAFIRENRAAQEQAQRQLEQVTAGAEAAKTLSGADLESDNALKRLVEQTGGVAT